jgi:hypothetical protein
LNGLLAVHAPKMSFSNKVLWGLTDYRLCHGRLHINLHPCHYGGECKVKSVQSLHFSRSEYRALAKAKLAPQTFTAIDLANKAKMMKNGHHVASKAHKVTITDGKTGKGIATTTLNACAQFIN